MNKKIIISICATLIVTLFFIFKNSSASNQASSISTEPQKENNSTLTNQEVLPVDKIKVVHFHGTHQCWSCITVGEYALQTIKDKFPEEYQSGKIVFKDINGELSENKEIVIKYQARGSSLFINTISNDKDSIEEDITVWRLVNNQENFTDYFENKLKTLLGK